VTKEDLAGKNAEMTNPKEVAALFAEADNVVSY
jgi:hypothetical protein